MGTSLTDTSGSLLVEDAMISRNMVTKLVELNEEDANPQANAHGPGLIVLFRLKIGYDSPYR